jgi:hypothetical protein
MVNSVVRPLYFPEPGDIEKVRPGFEEALAAEIETIVRRIPAKDLAIQWDLAGELLAVYGQQDNPPSESLIETHVAPSGDCRLCYRPRRPLAFIFASEPSAGGPPSRQRTWGALLILSMPPLLLLGDERIGFMFPRDRADEAFYAALARLLHGDCRVYLGMIHSMHSFRERMAVARKFVPDFGLAAYCGFGRTPPEQLPQLLADHLKAVELLNSA